MDLRVRDYKQRILRAHPSFTSPDDIRILCRPLEALGIVHFSHIHVDLMRRISFLAKNPNFLSSYLERDFQKFDICNLTPEHQESYYIRDLQMVTGETKQLQDEFNAHGFGHSFTITQSSKTGIDYYNFGAKLGNHQINQLYLQKLDLIKQFIQYFRNKVSQHKSLLDAYQLTLPLHQQDCGFQMATSVSTVALEYEDTSRIYVPGTNTYLTLREVECLSWLAKGKTQDEIALILNISSRTVRAHINATKEKLHCVNQFQLGLYYSQLVRGFGS